MRKILLITSVLALGLLLSGTSFAQPDDSGADNLDSPAALRCSGLGGLEQGAQGTAIYFIAGYYLAQRDATTIATVGQSDETAGETATEEAPQEGDQGGQAAGQPAGQPADGQASGAQSAAQPAEQPPAEAGAQAGGQAPAGGDAAAPAEGQAAGQGTEQATTGGPDAARVIPTLNLETIIAACAQSPDSRVSDIIIANGGGSQ